MILYPSTSRYSFSGSFCDIVTVDAETVLARHVIMPDHIVLFQRKPFAKPGRQLYQRIIGILRKFAGFIGMAALNGQSIRIPVIRSVSNLLRWYTLNDLSLKANHKMTADLRILTVLKFFKIILSS